MLENCNNNQERFARVQQLINVWLSERQELLVSYCSLSDIAAPAKDCENTLIALKKFCQVLVDYISAGHFEIYGLLAEEDEAFGNKHLGIFDEVMPGITASTDIALKFHETYDTDEHCIKAISRMKQELSIVGQAITQRFALEGILIAILHSSHEAELKAAQS